MIYDGQAFYRKGDKLGSLLLTLGGIFFRSKRKWVLIFLVVATYVFFAQTFFNFAETCNFPGLKFGAFLDNGENYSLGILLIDWLINSLLLSLNERVLDN